MGLAGLGEGAGLAIYVTVMFGALSLGSVIWGQAAASLGLGPAQFIAAPDAPRPSAAGALGSCRTAKGLDPLAHDALAGGRSPPATSAPPRAGFWSW